MDSLYGDLPLPISSNKNRKKKNYAFKIEKKYIDNLITPVIVQKNIENSKHDNEKDIKKGENELYEKEEDIFLNINDNIDNINKENIEKDNNIEKVNVEILNINKTIQNDLKKICDTLNKIQKGNKNENVNIIDKKNNKNDDNDLKNNLINNNFINNNFINNVNENIINDNKNEVYEKYLINDINEDYDPFKPNDLNKIIKERKRKKLIILSEKKKEMEREQTIEKEKEDKNELNKDLTNNINIQNIETSYNITTNIESDETEYINTDMDMKNKKMKNEKINENQHVENISDSSITKKKDFATRMMEKMGWKIGEGLGKDKQGIKTPLILQKVDKRSGVIVQAPEIVKKNQNNSYEKNIEIVPYTSRIIVLTNLVTANEIDDTLNEEIEEEASKFGNLLNIDIIVNGNPRDDPSAVKIYCEYESKEQAKNALVTLNKRTFAGRKVKAYFVKEKEYLCSKNK